MATNKCVLAQFGQHSGIARLAGRPKIPPITSNPSIASRPAQPNSFLISESSSSGRTSPSRRDCSIITYPLSLADFLNRWLSGAPTGRIGPKGHYLPGGIGSECRRCPRSRNSSARYNNHDSGRPIPRMWSAPEKLRAGLRLAVPPRHVRSDSGHPEEHPTRDPTGTTSSAAPPESRGA